jgi:glycosyltransferase involved in cell wall biosynthesis
MPGSHELPLLHQIVRKEYVSDDLSLDLDTWLSGMQGIPAVAGKLIIHTTEHRERQPSLPLDTPIGKVEVQLQGRNIVARTRTDLSWNSPITALPVDLVLPESTEQPGLPTVIMVMPFLAIGGAEQLAINLIKGLKNDIRFIILAAEELDPALGTLSDVFRELTPYVYNMADFLNPHLRTSFLWYLVERFHPSSIYIANGTAWIYDILPQIKQRYPDLQTINQVYDSQAGWINRYDINLVMHMDGHIGANRKICQAYQERGARPEQVHLIEHCVDLAGLNPEDYSPEQARLIRTRLGLPESGKIITFASRQHPQKRPMDFIELARRFERDPDVFFLMVGDGPLAGAIGEAIRKAGVKKVIRKPFYRPISDILAITDVLVLPSEYEGHPLIVAEAQVMGKPVVVTDVGNNRDVLEITHGGVVTSMIGDVEGLASGVRQMLAHPPDPHEMRSAYSSNFGDEVILKKYCRVLVGV